MKSIVLCLKHQKACTPFAAAVLIICSVGILMAYNTTSPTYRISVQSAAHRMPDYKEVKSLKILQQTSEHYSTYHIIDRKAMYVVSDRIQVLIQARDMMDNPRISGGDFFRAKIVSESIKAAARSDGEIVDFNNGSYLAEFTLRWPGNVTIRVMLVECSLAIDILERMRRAYPTRATYIATFKSGNLKETTPCNVDHVAEPDDECDFTDAHNGIPWFCRKPRNNLLTCDHWWWHNSNNSEIDKAQLTYINPGEENFFQSYKTFLTCINCSVPVVTPEPSTKSIDMYGRLPWQTFWKNLPPCIPTGVSKYDKFTSGYYYKDVWFSNRCRNRHFNTTSAMKCLQNKTVVILGDSTSRQMFSSLDKLMKLDAIPSVNCSTRKYQKTNNFTLIFKFHGLPTRGTHGGPSACMSYNAVNVIDYFDILPDVLVLSIGTHFTVHSVDFFKERVRLIKLAVERLHRRNPKTIFILKSANTRDFKNLLHILANNEWYIYTLDRSLREIFSDYPDVALLDEWDITVSQFYKDNVHPAAPVITNMVDLLLSYTCPL